MRPLLIALTFWFLAMSQVAAQEQQAFEIMNMLATADFLGVRCKNLPANVQQAVRQRQSNLAAAAGMGGADVDRVRRNAQQNAANLACHSREARNIATLAISDYGLRNTVAALVLQKRCTLWNDPEIVEALNRDMVSHARILMFTAEQLQSYQAQLDRNIQTGCDSPQVARLKGDVSRAVQQGRQPQPAVADGSAELAKQIFSMLMAGQVAHRKCRMLTGSEVGEVNRRTLEMARKLGLTPEQINTIRGNITAQVKRQQCDHPHIAGVLSWIRCGYPDDMRCN